MNLGQVTADILAGHKAIQDGYDKGRCLELMAQGKSLAHAKGAGE